MTGNDATTVNAPNHPPDNALVATTATLPSVEIDLTAENEGEDRTPFKSIWQDRHCNDAIVKGGAGWKPQSMSISFTPIHFIITY